MVTPKEKTPIDQASGKRVKVKFSKNPEGGGNQKCVVIAVNGTAFQYAYETEVEVPVEVLDAADLCVIDKWSQDAKNGMVREPIKRFPYTQVR